MTDTTGKTDTMPADGANGQEWAGQVDSSGTVKSLHRQERLPRVRHRRLRQRADLQAAVTRSSDSGHWSAARWARVASNGV